MIENSTHTPQNPKIQTIYAEGQVNQEARKLEMGVLGRLLGGAEKPGNIACLVIAFFMVVWGVVAVYGDDRPSLTQKQLLELAGTFITISLGFLFGRASKG